MYGVLYSAVFLFSAPYRNTTYRRKTVCPIKRQKSLLTAVIISLPRKRTFRKAGAGEKRARCPMRNSIKKNNLKQPTRRVKNCPARSARPFCWTHSKIPFPTKRNAKNLLHNIPSEKKSTPYGANRGFPRKYTCRNGTIFARLPTTTKSTPKKLSESLYGTHSNTL